MATAKNPEFAIEHIYIADLSFEAPTALHLLKKEWQPNADVKMKNSFKKVEDDHYVVTIEVSVNVTIDKNNVFIAEVQQCGGFLLKNFDEEQLEHVLEVYCPNILLPYARQTLSDMIIRGGFPPLFIGPVDFESQFKSKKTQEGTTTK